MSNLIYRANRRAMNYSRGQNKSIAVFSMKRAGQHYLVDWILKDYKKPYLFLNDIPLNRNPFSNFKGSSPFKTNVFFIRWFPGIFGRWIKKDLLIYNFEDPIIDQVYNIKDGIGLTESHTNILVLRDIYNLFASRYKGLIEFREDSRISNIIKEIWKMHAYEFLGATTHIPNLVVVNYNSLTTDPSYRDQIADKLEISPTQLKKISIEGGGSSFRDSDSSFEEDRFNSRLLTCLDNPYYQSVFKGDEEVYKINMDIFGSTLGKYQNELKKLVFGS